MIHISAPFYILSVGSAVVALLVATLPEPGGVILANTLEEGEAFGADQAFFHIPFIARRREEKVQEQEGESNGGSSVSSVATKTTVIDFD